MTQCLLNPRFTGPMVSSPMRLSPRIAARRWTELGVRGRLSGLKIDSRMAPSPGTPHPRVLISRPTTGAVREEEATTQQMTPRIRGSLRGRRRRGHEAQSGSHRRACGTLRCRDSTVVTGLSPPALAIWTGRVPLRVEHHHHHHHQRRCARRSICIRPCATAMSRPSYIVLWLAIRNADAGRRD